MTLTYTNCCNDHLTGYSVFVGRSTSLLGPYVDREGASFLDAQVGGTPVLSMNGNRWMGPGHNSILTDFGGQDWMVYHAVNRADPHFAGSPGFTTRAALLDSLIGSGRTPRTSGRPCAAGSGPLMATRIRTRRFRSQPRSPARAPGTRSRLPLLMSLARSPGSSRTTSMAVQLGHSGVGSENQSLAPLE